jgi:electron transfer flavoprotein alpha subunit
MAQIFAYILHRNGVIDDTAGEFLTAARRIDPVAQPTALVVGAGPDLDLACRAAAQTYRTVWKVDHKAVGYPNAEVIRKVLVSILPAGCIVLVPHEHFGMDLAPGLSIKLDTAFVPDVVEIQEVEGNQLKAVRQEFGGQISTHVTCDMSRGAVMTLRAGSFAEAEVGSGGGAVVDKSGEVGDLASGRRFLKVVEAETGDVDITKSEILVSCGRGFEDRENLELAFELAAVLGAEVSCSRPVVDAKWLEKSRQVGTSGKTVKPRVYLACGISGSFQHMGGIKGNTFLVAINKNPRAPIFQLAHVGVVADVLEFLPKLTEKLKES